LFCRGISGTDEGVAEVDPLDEEVLDLVGFVGNKEGSLVGKFDPPGEEVINTVQLVDDGGIVDAIELVGDECGSLLRELDSPGDVINAVESVDDEKMVDVVELVDGGKSVLEAGLFMMIWIPILKTKMKLWIGHVKDGFVCSKSCSKGLDDSLDSLLR
jgi:hypothetical protein